LHKITSLRNVLVCLLLSFVGLKLSVFIYVALELKLQYIYPLWVCGRFITACPWITTASFMPTTFKNHISIPVLAISTGQQNSKVQALVPGASNKLGD